jgi:HEAT repeat protein
MSKKQRLIILGGIVVLAVGLWGWNSYKGSTNYLVKLLSDRDEFTRARAAWKLSRFVDRPGVAEALTAALGDPSATVRDYAAMSLLGAGPKARQALPAMVAAAKKPQSGTIVLRVIGRLLEPRDAPGVWLDIVRNAQEPGIRAMAAVELGKTGDCSPEVLDALVALARRGPASSSVPATQTALAAAGAMGLLELARSGTRAAQAVRKAVTGSKELESLFDAVIRHFEPATAPASTIPASAGAESRP